MKKLHYNLWFIKVYVASHVQIKAVYFNSDSLKFSLRFIIFFF